MIGSGRRRHKISVQAPTETRSDVGGYTDGYAHSFYVKGNILGLAGKEYFAAGQTQGSETHKITVLKNTNTETMTLDYRMVWDSRNFNLISIVSDERGREYIIMAAEDV